MSRGFSGNHFLRIQNISWTIKVKIKRNTLDNSVEKNTSLQFNINMKIQATPILCQVHAPVKFPP